MKPSDRIKEMYNPTDSMWYSPNEHIEAIIKYLDEEWENNKSKGDNTNKADLSELEETKE